MTVRAKFRYDSYSACLYDKPSLDPTTGKADYTKTTKVEKRTLYFTPVYHKGDPAHENSKFWEASPSGKLELGTINEEAWSQFEMGKEYYLDFTPAE
ncbi:MAG: hypothetical protein AB7L09_21600 [Nitrospira sp.]